MREGRTDKHMVLPITYLLTPGVGNAYYCRAFALKRGMTMILRTAGLKTDVNLHTTGLAYRPTINLNTQSGTEGTRGESARAASND